MAVQFGGALRATWFGFDPDYRPLTHGSYGSYPTLVRSRQRLLQDSVESRSDPFIRFEIPKLLNHSRSIAATYLSIPFQDVVFVPNATTAVNTVLQNLEFQDGHVILYFSFAYPACVKSIQYVCETSRAKHHCIDLSFPAEDDEIVDAFIAAVKQIQSSGMRARLLMFETVVTFPGVRLPWERLVHSCREHNVLSLVDGAHGIGHIDLTSLNHVDPDFFTSNCYKWFFTPRPCAIFYVPRRNHHLIRSSLPTSHGFQPATSTTGDPAGAEPQANATDFVELFRWVATVDQSPYLCMAEAQRFREEVCGGEERIRKYCFNLAQEGGSLIAAALCTEVMRNSTGSINQCCFTNVRLPLTFATSANRDSSQVVLPVKDGEAIARWITNHSMTDHNTWIPSKLYDGAVWVRLSAQIYLDLDDFRQAANILLDLCSKVKSGLWKTVL